MITDLFLNTKEIKQVEVTYFERDNLYDYRDGGRRKLFPPIIEKYLKFNLPYRISASVLKKYWFIWVATKVLPITHCDKIPQYDGRRSSTNVYIKPILSIRYNDKDEIRIYFNDYFKAVKAKKLLTEQELPVKITVTKLANNTYIHFKRT